MARDLTQRELRNDSGEIMRALDAGETFRVTRNGVPVGDLTAGAPASVRRSRTALAAFADGGHDRRRPIPRGRRRTSGPGPHSACLTRLWGCSTRQSSSRSITSRPTTCPTRSAIATITLAELAAGPHATDDPAERARRQQRLQLAEATFDPLPFDAACARAYGLVYAQMLTAGRKARGSRAVDLLIGATAVANKLPLYTANVADFAVLGSLLEITAVPSGP